MLSDCTWTERPFRDLRGSVAYWAETTRDFDAFRGTYLTPPADPMRVPFRIAGARDGADLTHATCELADGWHVERVGPLVSTGGYDWWSVYWEDYADLSVRLARGDVPRIAAHLSAPVDADGRVVGLPPVHVHHVHLAPSLGLHNRLELVPRCAATGRDCLDASMLVQHHGDAQCDDDPWRCMLDDYNGTVKEVRRPLSVFGHFNDVRPAGSPPLAWYYVLGARFAAADDDRDALSVHAFGQPGTMLAWSFQTYVVTMPIRPDAYTAFHAWSAMPWNGTLRRFHFHAHQKMFVGSDLFAGTPDDVGVHRFDWSATWTDLDSLRAAVRANAPRGALRCAAERAVVVRGGVEYDRRSPVACRPWTFRAGDPVTIVAYDGPRGAATAFGGMDDDGGGATFPQHVSWFMEYVADDRTSHYTYSWASARPGATDELGTLRDTVRLLLHGRTPTTPSGALEEVAFALGLLAWLYVWAWPATLALLLLAACVPPARPSLVAAQGVVCATLYVRNACVFAFNDRDARLARPDACAPPSWTAVVVVVAAHAALAHCCAARASRPTARDLV